MYTQLNLPHNSQFMQANKNMKKDNVKRFDITFGKTELTFDKLISLRFDSKLIYSNKEHINQEPIKKWSHSDKPIILQDELPDIYTDFVRSYNDHHNK